MGYSIVYFISLKSKPINRVDRVLLNSFEILQLVITGFGFKDMK